MSTTGRVLTVVAVIWTAVWIMGAVSFFKASARDHAEADYLGSPITGVEPGTVVRALGTIEPGSTAKSPVTGEPCVAALVQVYAVSSYLDSQEKPQTAHTLIATRRSGPSEVGVRVGEARIRLPVEQWTIGTQPPGKATGRTHDELPAELGLSADDVKRAKSQNQTFEHFLTKEWRLTDGMPVFVAGQLDAQSRLVDDPVLHRIVVYAGSQDQLVLELKSSSSGGRVGGFIFIGVALLPLLILGVIGWKVRSRTPRHA